MTLTLKDIKVADTKIFDQSIITNDMDIPNEKIIRSTSDLWTINTQPFKINKGINLLDFLSKNKIMPSKSEARRAIANKGIKINNVLIVCIAYI